MTREEITEAIGRLSEMTAVELREFSRREGITITHLGQRKKADLAAILESALRDRLAA